MGLEDDFFWWRGIDIRSFGPIRSDPKRIYNPIKEINSSWEENIPVKIRNLHNFDQKAWQEMRSGFIEFGKESKLFSDIEIRNFSDIEIKNLTNSKSDPFQLQFEIRGQLFNFVDVGYGISQILPILEGILSNKNSKSFPYFLMQQPEVHLHPRAQAALSSLLIKMTKETNQKYIVETHSEFMVDRVRIEMRRGNIDHNDVSLAYFEADGDSVKIHNIFFDAMGNIENAPNNYNSFFIKEAENLFGIDL